jgi:hypothetical protein
MNVGDVVKTKNIRVEIAEGKYVSGTLGYNAPNKERFVFVLLGSEPADGSANLDPLSVFESLGWECTQETTTVSALKAKETDNAQTS